MRERPDQGVSSDPGERERAERAASLAVGEAGWAAPLLGAALLVSPLIRIASGDGRLFGAPTAFLYLFAVWAALIFFAARMARRAERAERAAQSSADAATERE